MSLTDCRKMRKVEALRDGRLHPSEVAAVEWHLESCAACARRMRELNQLQQQLSELPQPEADAASVARGRGRLLEAALREPRPAAANWSWLNTRGLLWVGACAVAAAAIVLVGSWWARDRYLQSPYVEVASRASETVRITAGADARWSRHPGPNGEIVEIEQGELSLRVLRHTPDWHLTVRTPDGEVEDLGTTFCVSVSNDRTEEVEVTEGSVKLMLRGRDAVVLHAGESWKSEAASKRSGMGMGSANPAPGSPERGATPEQPLRPEPAPEPRLSPRAAALAACQANPTYGRGLAAFKQGRYVQAAAEFGRFSSDCGIDRRAEDAAYMRTVALKNAGRTAEAQAAARAYLSRFPSGFRRKEAQSVASGE